MHEQNLLNLFSTIFLIFEYGRQGHSLINLNLSSFVEDSHYELTRRLEQLALFSPDKLTKNRHIEKPNAK